MVCPIQEGKPRRIKDKIENRKREEEGDLEKEIVMEHTTSNSAEEAKMVNRKDLDKSYT